MRTKFFKKIYIGYIHFTRKPVYQFFLKNNFIKFRKFDKPNYFLADCNYLSKEFSDKLSELFSVEEILKEGDLVLKNKFRTLGSEYYDFGEKINWQLDFKSGRVWEKKFYSQINSGESINKSDIKLPWEVSRFHQLLWLGKAYLVSKDQIYSDKILSLMLDWIDNNEVGYGVNWNCAMEVAIRAINWIIALEIIRGIDNFTKDIEQKILFSLYMHGLFIRNNLEYGRRNGNHYLSDLLGLVWIGGLFKNYSFGRKWIKFALSQLNKEIQNQIYEDGVDYEKSLYYQRLVFEILYLSQIGLIKNGYSLNDNSLKKLSKMLDFILSYNTEETIPNIGDNDNGRVCKFSDAEKISDFGASVLIGSYLLKRKSMPENLSKLIKKSDLIFFFGKEAFDFWETLDFNNQLKSKYFPKGGFYFFKNELCSFYLDSGDIGMNGWGGHGHNDVFSFELFYKSKNFICDSGTYCYTSEPEMRNLLRSTASHNTIIIDNREQAEFLNLFRIKKDLTNPKIISLISDETKDYIIAEHYGYTDLVDPVVHRREIEFDKKLSKFKIIDKLIGKDKHKINLNLIFNPKVEINIPTTNQIILFRGDSGKIKITILCDKPFSLSLIDHYVSFSYGELSKTKKANLEISEFLPLEITTLIEIIE